MVFASLACGTAVGDEQANDGAGARYLSFIPFVRENPCANRYFQLAASPPLQGTSDGGEGYPWRLLFGYCIAQQGRLSFHQDWVLSYLDATPQGDSPGGEGGSIGTDFSMLWQHEVGNALTPYYELGGGIQYAAGTPFPAHGSRWMFTINAGVGLLFPLASDRQLNTAIRYLHISNGGLFSNNAGYDGFHLVIGLRW